MRKRQRWCDGLALVTDWLLGGHRVTTLPLESGNILAKPDSERNIYNLQGQGLNENVAHLVTK